HRAGRGRGRRLALPVGDRARTRRRARRGLRPEPPARRGPLGDRGRQPRACRPRRAPAALRRDHRGRGARARPAAGHTPDRDLQGGRDPPAAAL
ncbi:MAG: hypothetical protein AVDCRST_MAG30-2947, partial [uncultured Solirubrobacteraceae bacterium]